MKYYLLVILMSIGHCLLSQAELIADINEGTGDSGIYCDFTFTENQNCVVRLDDKLIFHAENDAFGRELYVLEDGSVSLILDINNDPSSSNPLFLTAFQNAAYFLANDNTGYKIWQTDGTAEGTQPAFGIEEDDASRNDFSPFLVNGNNMYFIFQGAVYVYDGQNVSQIEYDDDIALSSSSAYNTRGWCSYKDGIAIFDYNGMSWDLLYVHDGAIEVISNFEADDSFKDAYGMSAFDGGISFGFEASFDQDVQGRYLYLEDSVAIIKQSDISKRNISIKNNSSLVFVNDEFIFYDKDNPMGVSALAGELEFTQGEDWNRSVTGDFLAFQSSGGFFLDDRVSLLNSLDGSISTIYTGDGLSSISTFANYVFFFAESPSRRLDRILYLYDINTDELREIEELEDLPANSDLYPLGAQGQFLYFFGKLDNALGIEIYRIELDINTPTQNLDLTSDISLLQMNQNSFQLKTDVPGEFTVDVFSVGGQLIKRQLMSNKAYIEIPYTGLVLISAQQGNVRETQIKYVSH